MDSINFSDFIRNATPEEKERVYLEVIDRAIARQLSKIQPEPQGKMTNPMSEN